MYDPVNVHNVYNFKITQIIFNIKLTLLIDFVTNLEFR